MTDKSFQRTDTVVARDVAGERILVPVTSDLADLERIFVLDSVGEIVWDALEDPGTLESIVDRVCDHFEVDREKAQKDCRAFLDELLEAGLVKEI
jgi:sensor domain CHASE-containing protein